jgi:hypothetical protein
LGGPIDHLLSRPQAEGKVQDRVAEVLHAAPRGPGHPPEFAHQRRHTRAVARGLYPGEVGFASRATPSTLGVVQEEVGDVHRQRWQREHLLGVGERGAAKRPLATGTRCRIHVLDVRRLQQERASPRMALACPAFAGGGATRGFGERRIGRGRLTGGCGGFVQPPLQCIDLLSW